MAEIIIGKHTLESLTSGMYSDPFVLYREYIQNAVDSIDEAIQKGILNKGEEIIEIKIHHQEKSIEIFDNGLGVNKDLVDGLLSIGNSNKSSENFRGFRGIGRLSGLSYCESLIFTTSSYGEKIGTKIRIDSKKLSMILADKKKDQSSVVDVINEIYNIEYYLEKEKEHYFNVTLDGVNDSLKLLDLADVEDYLSQNIPVPYNYDNFAFGNEIKNRISKLGYEIKSYNVILIHGNQKIKIFKPYADSFLVEKGKQLFDVIKDIQIIEIRNIENKIIALGWLGKSNYLGSIYDRRIKGLRLRTGNILIGDNQTLNSIFRDARFNGWSIGEIFTTDYNLIPNARRDNLEKNKTYFLFLEKLTKIASDITKEIRAASLRRNADLSSAIKEKEKILETTEQVLKDGISPSKKAVIKTKLSKAQNAINNAKVEYSEDRLFQEIAFDELDILIGKVQGTTSYKALNTMKNLSTTEKKILEKVIKSIIDYGGNDSAQLIDYILTSFQREI